MVDLLTVVDADPKNGFGLNVLKVVVNFVYMLLLSIQKKKMKKVAGRWKIMALFIVFLCDFWKLVYECSSKFLEKVEF